MVSRRIIQSVLGLVWFVDGLLQIKPQLFTTELSKDVLLPAAAGQPGWIADLVTWGATVVSVHTVFWNTVSALIQLAIGLAFMLNFKPRVTIVVSIGWSSVVWVFAEGLGQVLTGHALVVTGAPGAALLCGLVGVAVWPRYRAPGREWTQTGVRLAQIALAMTWFLGFVLNLQPAYVSANGLGQVVVGPSVPAWVFNHALGVSIILAVVQLALAVLFIFRIHLRVAVWVSGVVALVFWWSGQGFGQVLGPLATNLNSGLLMALLSLCACPEIFAFNAWASVV